MNAPQPSRPVLRYHGGKWMLAPWIISQFPKHTTYVEPFGGAASVLLRKPRSRVEVYNDLDGDVVNFFRVLRDPQLAELLRQQLHFTPFAREEFIAAYEVAEEPVERARRLVIRSFMGFGTTSRRANRTGFRGKATRRGAPAYADWASYPGHLVRFTERLRGVLIEHQPAESVIEKQDSPTTLFYVDPPYPFSTRTSVRWRTERDRGYAHNLSDDDHRTLARLLHQVKGMVVVSGYPCELYDRELYRGWHRETKLARADGAQKRVEVLWLNPAAEEHLAPTLFPEVWG